jgi:hypothetical protein
LIKEIHYRDEITRTKERKEKDRRCSLVSSCSGLFFSSAALISSQEKFAENLILEKGIGFTYIVVLSYL